MIPHFRRSFIVSLVALVAAAYPGIAVSDEHESAPEEAQPDERPNVLVIMTDDQREHGTMGVMPKTRAWFADGVSFRNAYVTTPQCCPSRATVFTGRYVHNHGVLSNRDAKKLDQQSTIQRYLQDAGYWTGFAGKYLNWWPIDEPPPFFDAYAMLRGGFFEYRVLLKEPDAEEGQVIDGETYATTFLSEVSTGFLQHLNTEDPDRPWFLFVTPQAPHNPLEPDSKYADADVGHWAGDPAFWWQQAKGKPPYVRRARAGLRNMQELRRQQLRMLLSVDDLVDDLFRELEELGELDNTLVFFLSDNGYMWGDFGLVGKGNPYLHSVRVPYLARWPGRLPASEVRTDLVGNVDITPTIMEAAGISPDSLYPVDGRSLLRETGRQHLLLERHSGRVWASLVRRNFQYIEHHRARGGVWFQEFYRLSRDPWQLRNVFMKDTKRIKERKKIMRLRTRRALRCIGTSGTRACP